MTSVSSPSVPCWDSTWAMTRGDARPPDGAATAVQHQSAHTGTGQADAFLEMFELVDAAEAWGLDIVWLAEMLINPARSVLSAPLLVASWIAARTRRVRMGTAVQLLPLNHPLRVAGEVTTLDHLSQGRFDFGIGRSGGTRGYDALGVPYEESQARFFEALEIILEAWKGEPFS